MSKFAWTAIFALINIMGLISESSAQTVPVYVSPTGSDNAQCNYAAPCKTFARAVSIVNIQGAEINVLSTGEYGAFTINTPLSISAVGVAATVTPSATDGIQINLGNGGTVSLKGLILTGNGQNQNGIRITNADDVEIEDCNISGFSGDGIFVSANKQTRVHIYHSRIYQNGTGIEIEAGRFVNGVVVENSSLDYNVQRAIYINGTNGALLIENSSIQGGPVLVTSGTPSVQSYGDNHIVSSFPATIIQRQ